MRHGKIGLLIAIILLAVTAFYILSQKEQPASTGLKPFASEEEFRAYLQESYTAVRTFGSIARGTLIGEAAVRTTEAPVPTEGLPSRVSTTNVQVAGIDEPDILKTDGKSIFFSSRYFRPYEFGIGIKSRFFYGDVKVIKAYPPEELELQSKIDELGDLLLYNKVLLIFSDDRIAGYDVSNPAEPVEDWKIALNSSVVTARLYAGKLYLILSNSIDYYRPCPVVPITKDNQPLLIACNNIYHPDVLVPADVTYTILVLDPETGEVEKVTSFVGSSSSSVVYMSSNAIYITYTYTSDYFNIYFNFLKEKCSDLIPAYVLERLEKVNSYDISAEAKLVELWTTLEKYKSSLSSDDRLKLENELANRLEEYYKEHKRDFVKTGIVKVSLDMNILALGEVPGTPINQFALDEYQGYLRIATTVGMGSASANDVYVLDSSMQLAGSVKDLGLEERIYSVRFVQEKGYIVTFRQTDPFYVLDLSEPTSPALKGELKIPGFSSYLHPINHQIVLGIGKEDWNVKISLFDVSSAERPTELDKYILDEYWSDVLNTHHAFLLDDEHEVFFLPAAKGGYIFSYKGNKLQLVKAVAEMTAKRAVYIEDYLYIVGEDKVVALDENSWEKVGELAL